MIMTRFHAEPHFFINYQVITHSYVFFVSVVEFGNLIWIIDLLVLYISHFLKAHPFEEDRIFSSTLPLLLL